MGKNSYCALRWVPGVWKKNLFNGGGVFVFGVSFIFFFILGLFIAIWDHFGAIWDKSYMLFGYYWGCLAIILEGITIVDRHHSGPSHGHLAKKSYAGFGKSILFSGTHCFIWKIKKNNSIWISKQVKCFNGWNFAQEQISDVNECWSVPSFDMSIFFQFSNQLLITAQKDVFSNS